MTNPLTCLLVLVLLSVTSVNGERNGLQETGRTILSPDEAAGMHVVVSQFFSGGGLLLACFYVLMHLFKPLYTLFTEPPAEDQGHGEDTHGGGHRSLLNSIDFVDATFNVMNVEDAECRKRAICELQKAASRMPLWGDLLESASSSINGLEKYKEAQRLGATFEDCQLLFQCSRPPLGFS
ncbi:uncharacterized protein LOC125040981 [Penaeus chinensis]|uniref:uncharacterized protein LOC125040981 n=1 Tax=Penaeus chinensis TaxID=139456 RepID=UPI001FB6353A|nr:uncharacterized protein LOC125040981 [Penaeus chinensis]